MLYLYVRKIGHFSVIPDIHNILHIPVGVFPCIVCCFDECFCPVCFDSAGLVQDSDIMCVIDRVGNQIDEEIPINSRATQGVRLKRLDQGDKVVAIASVYEPTLV